MAGFPHIGAYVSRQTVGPPQSPETAPLYYVNVADYYKSGDTDDSASILRAWEALESLGGVLLIPPRLSPYNVSQQLGGNVTPSYIAGLTILGGGSGYGSQGSNLGYGTVILSSVQGPLWEFASNSSGNLMQNIALVGPGVSAVGELSFSGTEIPAGSPSGATGVVVSSAGWGFSNLNCSGFTSGLAITGAQGIPIINSTFRNNRNAGILIYGGVGGIQIVGGYCGNTGDSATGRAANLLVASDTSSNTPEDIGIFDVLFDEPLTNQINATISNIEVLAGSRVSVDCRRIWVPASTTTGTYYGVHVGSSAVQVMLRKVHVEPFQATADRVPTHTIQIDTGAVGTILEDVVTNPNGGGDINDLGSDTLWRGVSMNGGPIVSAVALKAGVPSDADYQVPPPIGTQVLDTSTATIYFKTAAGTWSSATLA